MKKPILVLAGGVGGSKLIKGLESVYKPDDIFFVINTADDQDFYGLLFIIYFCNSLSMDLHSFLLWKKI